MKTLIFTLALLNFGCGIKGRPLPPVKQPIFESSNSTGGSTSGKGGNTTPNVNERDQATSSNKADSTLPVTKDPSKKGKK